MEKLILKKCGICGGLVEDLHSSHLSCCGKEMTEVLSNSVDAAVEKHVPIYEISDGNIVVTVHHVMEEDHYIEWIALVSGESLERIYLKPGDSAVVTFCSKTNGILYAYCNKHGLWETEIK